MNFRIRRKFPELVNNNNPITKEIKKGLHLFCRQTVESLIKTLRLHIRSTKFANRCATIERVYNDSDVHDSINKKNQ